MINNSMVKMNEKALMRELQRLHEAIWDDDTKELESLLIENKTAEVISKKGEFIPFIDGKYRGTTALGLAAQLGREKCIEVLLKYWADTLESSDIGYYPLQEATSYGDREIIKMLLLRRHEQMRQLWKVRQPELFTMLRNQVPDFFLEMDWHFRSWVPFLARFCPADRCRIWKHGSNLRLDSTLMGVEMQRMGWRVGNVSFIFKIGETGSNMYALDHDQLLYEEIDKMVDYKETEIEEDLNMRLNTQIYSTKVRKPKDESGRKIVKFLRKHGGLFGLGGELQEQVGVYTTDVYDVPGIELITRYRREHLIAREQLNHDREPSMNGEELTESLESGEILEGIHEYEAKADGNYLQSSYKSLLVHTSSLPAPEGIPRIKRQEYFSAPPDDYEEQQYLHVGRNIIESSKSKKFRVTVWMAKDFPMTIDQLMPLFEVLTIGNRNFQKVREFVSMELPPGFPVRIEIPIFAFLSAQITFLNFRMWQEKDEDDIPRPKFVSGDDKSQWFEIPPNYKPGIVIKGLLNDDDQ